MKSYGASRWTDKETGKGQSKPGPMYIHFNENCLKKFDNSKFYPPDELSDYSFIVLSQQTLTNLNEKDGSFLRRLGLTFQMNKYIIYCKVFLMKLNELT